jgi:hypothetical protein
VLLGLPALRSCPCRFDPVMMSWVSPSRLVPWPVSSGRSATTWASPAGRSLATRPARSWATTRPERSYQGPPGLGAEPGIDVGGDGLADLVSARQPAARAIAQVAAKTVGAA